MPKRTANKYVRLAAYGARAHLPFLLVLLLGHPAQGQQTPVALDPAIAAGAHHTCALTESGSLFCWGANNSGQTGDPAATSVPPHAVPGIRLAAITAGGEHTCGLDSAGVAWCWGSNEFGQIGDGRKAHHHQPRRVVGGLRFGSITAGGSHTCALTAADHRAFCWGDQWDRAAGTFATGENLREPLPVRGDVTFRSLSAGGRHTCGIADTGSLFCWGDNSVGQVRPDRRDRSYYRPEPLAVSDVFTEIAAGISHSCALASGGRVYCWGSNAHGQLGPGGRLTPSGAEWVATSYRFTGIAAGGNHTCGVTTDAEIVCWGGGRVADVMTGVDGQAPGTLGLASPPGATRRFARVTAGVAHVCATSTDGGIWCWGDDRQRQLGASRANGDAVLVVLPGR